jgi:hypothetical protein
MVIITNIGVYGYKKIKGVDIMKKFIENNKKEIIEVIVCIMALVICALILGAKAFLFASALIIGYIGGVTIVSKEIDKMWK